MISIIIPTFNEEKYLPKLLNSIKNQSFKEYEIIVSDNNSNDKTLEVAKKNKCKTVKGGLPGMGRNNGAKAAKYDWLLFLDSDVLLPKMFLESFFEKSKKYDYATCRIEPLTHNFEYRFFYMLKNYSNYISRNHISGQCLLIKKRLFEKIEGYDGSLTLGEEHDLAKRLRKHGKGKFFMNIIAFNYPRRLEKDGMWPVLFKSTLSELHRFFIGPIRNGFMKQEYGKYK